MPPDWDALLLAYLHDPPDKALAIPGHEGRAAHLLRIAVGEEIERRALHTETRTEDILASRAERVVAMPTAGASGERAVGVESGILRIMHPLSGIGRELPVGSVQEAADVLAQTLSEIVGGLDPVRARALAVWRLWRERLAQRQRTWGMLPADTRLPDHPIWNHTDVAMGCRASTQQHGLALLTFVLGPVQPFIAAARTVRDLWTGSYLLAWLTFAAMRPILQECGPAAILSPSLRGNPLMDHWLRELPFDESPQAPRLLAAPGLVPPPAAEPLLSPCLPNRFTAFVPWGQEGTTAHELAAQCEKACRAAWGEVCDAVRRRFDQELRRREVPHADGWDRWWDDQVGSFFEVHTATLPINDCTDETLGRLLSETGCLEDALEYIDLFRVRGLAACIPADHRPSYPADQAGPWMGMMDLVGRLLAAQRALRPLPDYRPDGDGPWPGKCSLLGTYEQLGPADRERANAFWDGVTNYAFSIDGTRLRDNDRLCAVSLVKRFAWAAYFRPTFRLDWHDLRYPDTATVAATCWLRQAEITPDDTDNWSGQWLHWSQPDQDEEEDPIPDGLWRRIRDARQKHGRPPAYYAVLMLDGDHMGQWLRGALGPKVREVLHPRMVRYFEGLPNTAVGLDARRPIGPAFQAALSEALTNFALHFVPRIVREHAGTLIYAGGDDVLALLPTTQALACAAELNRVYRQNWDAQSDRLLMGERATVSAGIAVAHYKEDLRAALAAARAAEKQAKAAGRNALCVRVVRRSGEDSSAVVGWEQAGALQELVDDFVSPGPGREGASDRWAYRLRAELVTLDALGDGPFRAELVRLLGRVEQAPEGFARRVVGLWDAYTRFCQQPERCGDNGPMIAARTFFVTLCQSASFLARGRDER